MRYCEGEPERRFMKAGDRIIVADVVDSPDVEEVGILLSVPKNNDIKNIHFGEHEEPKITELKEWGNFTISFTPCDFSSYIESLVEGVVEDYFEPDDLHEVMEEVRERLAEIKEHTPY